MGGLTWRNRRTNKAILGEVNEGTLFKIYYLQIGEHSKKEENQVNNSNSVSSKLSDEDEESETAWNFNDFIELAEKDN